MIHENLPQDYLVAVVEEKHRALRQHRLSSRRGAPTDPGRLRRTVAAALVRLAELLVRHPLAQRPIRYGATSPCVTAASGASARRGATG